MKKFFSFLAISLLNLHLASALPARVLLIRHGEKPSIGNHLSSQGQERAQNLVSFFEHNPEVNAFGPITAIYAMAPKNGNDSVRAIETVTPAAQAMNLPIQENFTKTLVDDLASEIKKNPAYDGHTVLICWEHDYIPKIVKAFGLNKSPAWPGDDVYDRMWMLTFGADGSIDFQDVGEHVLPGDSP